MVDIWHFYTFVQTQEDATPRASPRVNYGLHGSSVVTKVPRGQLVVQMLITGEAVYKWRQREISVPFPSFAVNLKLLLKNSLLKKET